MDRREERKLALERQIRPKHLAFCRELIRGETLADGYKAVYRCSDSSAKSAACRLWGTQPLLREYYEVCTGLVSDSAIVDRATILNRLWEVSDNKAVGAQGAVVAALKELLAQQGSAPASRVEMSGPKGGAIATTTEDVTPPERKGLRTETVVNLAAQLFGVSEDKARAMFTKGRPKDDADGDQKDAKASAEQSADSADK